MKLTSYRLPALGAVALALLAGCASTPALNDGELALPADYKSWPKFLSAVQRPDNKQVREIYMSPSARSATPAGGFGNGTVFVMENYAAKQGADGKPLLGPDGRMIKGELLRVFVMGKDAGWGQKVADGLRNGSWVYAAYLADGKKAPDDLNACRACHLPQAGKDFVHRYDEHFASR